MIHPINRIVVPLLVAGLVQAQSSLPQVFQRPPQQTQQSEAYSSECPDCAPETDLAAPNRDAYRLGLPAKSAIAPVYRDADPNDGPDRNQADRDPRRTAAVRDPVKEPPTEFQRFVASSTGRMLPIFGSQLFEHVPSTFAPVERLPAQNEYAIGPGDQIELSVWGQINFNERFTVNRSGDVFLPQVGRVSISGVKFVQLRDVLRSAMGRLYRSFDLNVNMGQLRSMQIFVLGQARRPGTYTVSSLSTLVNALFACGGPSSRGSLRNIQLKRGAEVVTIIDLYDLLLQGDKSKDVPLFSGDIIFIPDAGPRVAIEGSVPSAAIYELKEGTTLSDVVGYAGGLSPTAAGQRAILERIQDRSKLHSEDIALTASGLSARPQNGDIIRILSLVPQFEETVSLRGNVADPVRVPWYPGMKISGLIPNKESLLTRNYWHEHNELVRQEDFATSSEKMAETSPSGVSEKVIRGLPVSRDETVAIASGDSPTTLASLRTGALVTRDFEPKNDVRPLAPDIYWSYASIERLNQQDLTTHIMPFNLGKVVIDHDASADLALQPGDIVTIFSSADVAVPRSQQTKYIRLEGEINMAGVYSVNPGETLRDVVSRAGGLTPGAYLFGTQFTREATRKEQQKRYSEFLDQLERDINQHAATLGGRVISADQAATSEASIAGQRTLVQHLRATPATGRIVLDLAPGSTGVNAIPDLPLENGDRLLIPSLPSLVNVVGMVYNQASFLYSSDYRLGDYLSDAGGPSRFGDRAHMFVIRADGSVVAKDSRSGLFSSRFDSLRMYPGDTLVVPANVTKTTLMRTLLDWSQVIGNFGLGAAAINVLK